MEILKPRITKSTAPSAVKARFQKTSEMLKRFEVAKQQASLWDGERDGLREAVKTLEAGKYDDVSLSWSTSAPVVYPNAEGKHQITSTLQTDIPPQDVTSIAVFHDIGTPKRFLDSILHQLQTSKEAALDFVTAAYITSGDVVPNGLLFESKTSEKATIVIGD